MYHFELQCTKQIFFAQNNLRHVVNWKGEEKLKVKYYRTLKKNNMVNNSQVTTEKPFLNLVNLNQIQIIITEYTVPIDLAPNGILFGAKSFGNV